MESGKLTVEQKLKDRFGKLEMVGSAVINTLLNKYAGGNSCTNQKALFGDFTWKRIAGTNIIGVFYTAPDGKLILCQCKIHDNINNEPMGLNDIEAYSGAVTVNRPKKKYSKKTKLNDEK